MRRQRLGSKFYASERSEASTRTARAGIKTTQRYLNVTDEELRKTMQQKLRSHKS